MTPVFEQKSVTGLSRSGVLKTRAGNVLTPTFMPDGTRGTVKSLTADQVKTTGVEVVLCNTFHLHLQPGEATIAKLGGIHEYGKWRGPILSDSGGFQVFSLAKIRKITEEGVTFQDPVSGDTVFLSPEKSIQIQMKLGADLLVAFDDVTALDTKGRDRTQEAFDRTHRWLERSLAEFQRLTKDMPEPWVTQEDAGQGATAERKGVVHGSTASAHRKVATQASASSNGRVFGSAGKPAVAVSKPGRPLLFGVVQGGLDKKLRKKSLEIVQSLPVDGIAIGGLSVGESREEMHDMLKFLAPFYDPKHPRFLLGVGDPVDLRFAIEHGIDMLDCVLPTRNARHGSAWVTSDKTIHLTNAKFIDDKKVIDEGCDCTTCVAGYSRGFLRHQFKVGESLAGSLVSIHNIRYLQKICEEYRKTKGGAAL